MRAFAYAGKPAGIAASYSSAGGRAPFNQI